MLPPEIVGPNAVRYGVETGWQNLREHAPPGLLPFADDTGGNLWACDGRARRRDPAIVFIDHELAGDDAIFPVAPRFDAFGDARGQGLIAIAARHRRVLVQRAGHARWVVTPLPVANYCRLDSSRP